MNYFRRLDLFPKINQDIEVHRTFCGGLVFIVTAIFTTYLIVAELNAFLYGDPYPEPYIVSSHTNDRVRVNLNLSFYNLPCAAISLDYQDITGTHIENVQHTLYKLRLSPNGYILDEHKAEKVRQFESSNLHPSNPILKFFSSRDKVPASQETSCYGAEMYMGQKCITCQDVLGAYLLRGWPAPPLEAVAQCSVEALAQVDVQPASPQIQIVQTDGEHHHHRLLQQQTQTQEMKVSPNPSASRRLLSAEDFGQEPNHMTLITQDDLMAIQEQLGEGCQLYGHLFIRKVPGNFHISIHGRGLGLTMLTNDVSLTHEIHLLEFTTERGEVTLGKYSKSSNSLDTAVLEVPSRVDVQYYLKIVSSSYQHPIWGEEKFYEFRSLSDTIASGTNIPKVEFKYEFDPISIRHKTHAMTLGKFVVSLCAIIGGIFASSLLIERVFEKFE